MRWKLWVIFGAVQSVGFLLPIFVYEASKSSDGYVPMIMGQILLLPGSLIRYLLPLSLAHNPLMVDVLSIVLNALFLYVVAEIILCVMKQDKGALE